MARGSVQGGTGQSGREVMNGSGTMAVGKPLACAQCLWHRTSDFLGSQILSSRCL